MCRWPGGEKPCFLDLNKRLCVIGFSLHSNSFLFHPQAVFAFRFAVGNESKFLPLLAIGYRVSGTKRRIVPSISIILSSWDSGFVSRPGDRQSSPTILMFIHSHSLQIPDIASNRAWKIFSHTLHNSRFIYMTLCTLSYWQNVSIKQKYILVLVTQFADSSLADYVTLQILNQVVDWVHKWGSCICCTKDTPGYDNCISNFNDVQYVLAFY